MIFHLEIGTDNKAFNVCPNMEIASILKCLAETLQFMDREESPSGDLYDYDGNLCGFYRMKEKDK
jgi:hypothetical protein